MEFAAISVISTVLVAISVDSAAGAMQKTERGSQGGHSTFLTPGLSPLQGAPVSQRPDLSHQSPLILVMPISGCFPA